MMYSVTQQKDYNKGGKFGWHYNGIINKGSLADCWVNELFTLQQTQWNRFKVYFGLSVKINVAWRAEYH